MTIVAVVVGGPPPPPAIAGRLPPVDAVIVADSGLDNALSIGLTPTLLIGDLDSISEPGLEWARTNNIPIEAHPPDKNATDLDLALDVACRGADQVVVVDSGVGRVDHAFANLSLLASPRFAGVELSAFVGNSTVSVVRSARTLRGRAGDTVSLVPVGGTASGVSVRGVRWPLSGATLVAGSTLGVSNVFTEDVVDVSVDEGVLFAIQPWDDT